MTADGKDCKNTPGKYVRALFFKATLEVNLDEEVGMKVSASFVFTGCLLHCYIPLHCPDYLLCSWHLFARVWRRHHTHVYAPGRVNVAPEY